MKRPGRFHPALTAGLPALALATALAVAGAAAQVPQDRTTAATPAAPAIPFSLSDPVPVDSAVTIEKLPNGMTVYFRRNGWPEKRVSLRLALKAGSVMEDDDQQGVAHFIEHMNFNGSAHFKPGELVTYLESIGARFGADANAFTSFDQTVYMLDLATDRDTLLDRGIMILSDYAARATLSDVEIDKERGVILEEWRLGTGASDRIGRKQYPVLYHGSRYAERLPIGKPEIIQNVPYQRVRDFHRTWYRPELMALAVVGDVDQARVEALVREHLGDIPATGLPAEPPTYAVPPHAETLYSVATDPEARGSSVSIVYKRPHDRTVTWGDFRQDVAENLFYTMLSARLEELARLTNAPFLGARAGGGRLGRTVDTFNLGARIADGGIEAGLKALLLEARRVQEHGFGQAELDRARDELLSRTERAFNERDRTENPAWAREYISHFLTGEPIPGTAAEFEAVKALLPGITLDDINEVTRRFIHDDSRVITASAPEKAGLTAPTEEGLQAVLAGAAAEPVAAWNDRTVGRSLMERKPEPGRLTATRQIPDLGVTVLTLSNGVEVWLKPTDFKRDEVRWTAYAPGGASLADPAHYPEAIRSPAVIDEAGVGGFEPVELQKLLAGRMVSGSPFVGNYIHGLSGWCTPKDLETAFQLLYLTITQPTDRPEAFEVLKKRLRSDAVNRLNDPDAVFGDRVTAVNSCGHYFARPLTPGGVDSLQLAPALEFYRQRFANAADFTFFVVGSFQVSEITPLVEQYLAALPSTGKRTSAFVDRGYAFPDGVVIEGVRKGIEPKSRTVINFWAGATGLDEMEMYRARSAATVLRMSLREILREELGATYGVSVSYGNQQPYPGYATELISFGSSPENVDKMVAAIMKELGRLRAEGPTAAEIQKVQEMQRREMETQEKDNGYWLGSLQTVQMLGWDPLSILRRRDRIETLTGDALRDTFRKCFPDNRYTRVTLYPEAGVAGPPEKK